MLTKGWAVEIRWGAVYPHAPERAVPHLFLRC